MRPITERNWRERQADPETVGALQLDGTPALMARLLANRGVRDPQEARAYLAHPVLGPRLVQCTEAALHIEGCSALEIFGSPDDMKLRSSATLFASVSPDGSVFHGIIDKYFDGEQDARTIALMSRAR